MHEIKQQQQEQSVQMQQLQQQLVHLQQQLIAENIISTLIQDHVETPGQLEPPTAPAVLLAEPSSPLTLNQEVVNVAASASSYLAAFSNLAAGRLLSAETGFQEFLRDFPDHQYSPNARYWLANAQLSQGKTNLAMANLQQIIVDPNAQTKAPAALMQLAQIYRQEGLPIQADNVLEQLRNRYPESPEAQQIYRSNEPTN
ncbi:MAG: tetratricopeptide repeat protein [Desulfuromusa sp.]|nr:tetratricopeptide repeat protein [Desulfuromusa sp.]